MNANDKQTTAPSIIVKNPEEKEGWGGNNDGFNLAKKGTVDRRYQNAAAGRRKKKSPEQLNKRLELLLERNKILARVRSIKGVAETYDVMEKVRFITSYYTNIP